MHLVHQQAIRLGMLLLIKEDRAAKKPQQTRPVAPVVVTPGPVFGIGAGFVAPLIQVHGRMADAHRHLGHEVLAVVEHQPKQGPLLGGGQQTKQAGEGISQAVEAEVGAPGAHVADQIATLVVEPFLEPGGHHLGLHIEFVLPLLFAELLGGSPPQHLHGFAGDPVVLVEKPAQILNPLAGEHQALLQQPTHRALLGQGHQLIAAAQAAKQQHLHLQGRAPDIHRAVNHEGAVGHKQHRCAFKGGVQHQVEQQLHAPLHVLVGAEAVVVAALHVQPAEHRPPEGCIHR